MKTMSWGVSSGNYIRSEKVNCYVQIQEGT